MFGKEHRILHRLEDDDARQERSFLIASADREGGRHAGRIRIETRHRVIEEDLRRHLESHPRASIAAIVHEIVNQPGMTAQRDAAACRLEIGLRSDRVLLIAELVAYICDQFRKRDADIRFACFLPTRAQADSAGPA